MFLGDSHGGIYQLDITRFLTTVFTENKHSG